MAKGFTVKAKPPAKKPEAEWDIDDIKKECVVRQLYFVFQVEDVLLYF